MKLRPKPGKPERWQLKNNVTQMASAERKARKRAFKNGTNVAEEMNQVFISRLKRAGQFTTKVAPYTVSKPQPDSLVSAEQQLALPADAGLEVSK